MSDRVPAKIFSGSLSRPATRRVTLIEGDEIGFRLPDHLLLMRQSLRDLDTTWHWIR